jgi:transposase
MSEGEEYMPERFVNVDRETQMLLPPDLREWVAGDDLVHFVILAVESADLSAVATRQHGGGSPAYPPSMMMALLIYAYANGIFRSRQIERATHDHLSMRYLCANLHPDHDTICTFRRENHALLKAVFSQVLKLASTMGLLQVGTVCLDGTKIVANAAKRRTLDFDQMEQAEQRIQQQIEGLLKQAEAADGRADSSDSGGLPQELANRKRLKEKMSQARALLGEAVQQRAETRARERQQWAADPIGDEPRALSPEPRPKDRINLTDPECSLMPLSAGGYAPAYNAQVAVSGQRCALIVATEVGQQPNDRQQLLGMANLIKKAVPQVEQIVTDTGYDHARQIDHVERIIAVQVCCPPQEAPTHKGPLKGRVSKGRNLARNRATQVRRRMRQRANSPEGRKLMELRKMTVEPAIGLIQTALGFRRFSLRGLAKVNLEWELVALAFNCRRIVRQLDRN